MSGLAMGHAQPTITRTIYHSSTTYVTLTVQYKQFHGARPIHHQVPMAVPPNLEATGQVTSQGLSHPQIVTSTPVPVSGLYLIPISVTNEDWPQMRQDSHSSSRAASDTEGSQTLQGSPSLEKVEPEAKGLLRSREIGAPRNLFAGQADADDTTFFTRWGGWRYCMTCVVTAVAAFPCTRDGVLNMHAVLTNSSILCVTRTRLSQILSESKNASGVGQRIRESMRRSTITARKSRNVHLTLCLLSVAFFSFAPLSLLLYLLHECYDAGEGPTQTIFSRSMQQRLLHFGRRPTTSRAIGFHTPCQNSVYIRKPQKLGRLRSARQAAFGTNRSLQSQGSARESAQRTRLLVG